MVRKVLSATNPSLREKSKNVSQVDKKILKIIQDLKDTLKIQKDPEGVGLAAPQIGKKLRLFIVNHQGLERIIINPEILEVSVRKNGKTSYNKSGIMEGCLSLPHYYGSLTRARRIKLKYLTEAGSEKTEVFKGFPAQIILHEMDHLEGILFVDRLIEQKEPLYKLNKNKWEEVELI